MSIKRRDLLNFCKISIDSKIYPRKLKEISNPPQSLYMIGNVELLQRKSIAIIGSRKCSENGKFLTKKFAEGLSKNGITVISGMAERN